MHNVDDPKRTAPNCSEERHGRHTPQNEFEIEVVTDMCAVICFADGHGENGIGNHPCHHHVCTDGAVVVFLLLRFADTWCSNFESVAQIAERLVIPGIDIQLLAWHFKLDRVSLAAHCSAEILVDDVIALGAPGHVVGVAESVNLQCADV